jgi:hypothetical protein
MKIKKLRIFILVFLFIVYFFIAARPVPLETILAPSWISDLKEEAFHGRQTFNGTHFHSGQLIPFVLGDYFGYVDSTGYFVINQTSTNDIYLSENMWTEYTAEPSSIEIKNISEDTIVNIENPGGYPVLLDNRIFIIGSEMNSLSEIDTNGNTKWIYEFGAPLTSIDAAAGLVVVGSLDGVVEILDSNGYRIFYFEPGGSRLSVILGCVISGNGSRVGIISGIDKQRFILLERLSSTDVNYRVVYHEYLEDGFRRPVHISFIDEDRRIIYERMGGISCYNIKPRRGVFIPLDGEIAAFDNLGTQGLLFVVTSSLAPPSQRSQQSQLSQRELIGINIPQDKRFAISSQINMQDAIFLKASFKSDDVFFSRTGSILIVGGGSTLISFSLEEK